MSGLNAIYRWFLAIANFEKIAYNMLMHKVAILALQNVVLLDLSIPVEIFSRARANDGMPCYLVKICGPSKIMKESSLSLRLNHSLASLSWADTIVIPGTNTIHPLSKIVRKQLVSAHKRGARIISLCSGAFYLAETGLLDGLSATTHWVAAEQMKAKFPKINVDPNVLYVDEGKVMTSAGACAGIDLCLHIVRKDFGAAVAAHSARIAVMPLERSGGQAQHIVHAVPSKAQGSLSHVLDWIEENLERDLSLKTIAKKACMSVRTLNRQFQSQTGTSPLKWLLSSRIRRAKSIVGDNPKFNGQYCDLRWLWICDYNEGTFQKSSSHKSEILSRKFSTANTVTSCIGVSGLSKGLTLQNVEEIVYNFAFYYFFFN